MRNDLLFTRPSRLVIGDRILTSGSEETFCIVSKNQPNRRSKSRLFRSPREPFIFGIISLHMHRNGKKPRLIALYNYENVTVINNDVHAAYCYDICCIENVQEAYLKKNDSLLPVVSEEIFHEDYELLLAPTESLEVIP